MNGKAWAVIGALVLLVGRFALRMANEDRRTQQRR
jgi:hypothetical protein